MNFCYFDTRPWAAWPRAPRQSMTSGREFTVIRPEQSSRFPDIPEQFRDSGADLSVLPDTQFTPDRVPGCRISSMTTSVGVGKEASSRPLRWARPAVTTAATAVSARVWRQVTHQPFTKYSPPWNRFHLNSRHKWFHHHHHHNNNNNSNNRWQCYTHSCFYIFYFLIIFVLLYGHF